MQDKLVKKVKLISYLDEDSQLKCDESWYEGQYNIQSNQISDSMSMLKYNEIQIEHQSQPQDDSEPEERLSKQENTLSMLTVGFLKLIKQMPNQILNLNYASEQLKVKKRRLYDVTNVLEGVGYLEKVRKNEVKFVGYSDETNIESQNEYCNQKIVNQALNLEEQIDKVHQSLYKELSEILKNTAFKKYMYIYPDDIREYYLKPNQSLILIDTPLNTEVNIPYENQPSSQNPKIKEIIISHLSQPIDIYHISKEGELDQQKQQEKEGIDQQNNIVSQKQNDTDSIQLSDLPDTNNLGNCIDLFSSQDEQWYQQSLPKL